MKTLAEFKRRLKLGVRVTLTANWLEQPETRTVEIVQTNAVAFRRPNGRLSWLYWPKASACRFNGESVTIVDDTDEKYNLTYTF